MDGVSGRPGASGPSTTTAYAGPLVNGCVFGVTQGGMWLTQYRYWVPATGGEVGTTGFKACLYQLISNVSSALVPGSTVTFPALTAGWNVATLPTPIALSPFGPASAATYGAVYTAAIGGTFAHGFAETKNQFGSTNTYAAGITNGPLFAFSSLTGSAAPGGTNNWSPQQPFTTATSDPTAVIPLGNDNDANLWVDVTVSDTAPSGATYRAFPNSPVFNAFGTGAQIGAYTLGLEFTLKQACKLQRIWHYSPATATVLPTRCAIWDVGTQAVVPGSDNQSPVWSGAAGSGWVSCDYTSSGVILTGGPHYKVSTFTANNTAPWFNAVANWWGTGDPFANGIVNGPLTILNNASATPGQDSWNQSATWTYPATSTNPEYDGVDVEVTPVTTGPYRIFPSANGPATASTYTGNFISGTVFAVKGGGNWFEGYWWWVCGSGQSTAPVKCALWTARDGTHGELVPGSVVTSGTLTAGQWNYIPLPTPIQLAPGWDTNSSINGSLYVAAIGCNGSFPDTNGYWGPVGGVPGPGSNGIANGPLFAYSCANAVGATNQAPWSMPQGVFSTAIGPDPSVAMPASQSTVDNFWVDVQVTNVAPAGYTGSYRLWPNKADANSTGTGDAAFNYTIATEVHLTQKCTLEAIWYYRPNSATTMATRCDVWNINTGLSVASITSPVWLNANGSAFAAGTGGNGTWAKALFSGGVTLPAGQYRVSVYNANGTTDGNWSVKDASTDYWGETFTGAGSSGIDWGVINAPNWAGASPGFLYGGTGSENPPFSAGGSTPHAQPVFAEGVFGNDNAVGFPQLNAPVGGSSNETQNYFVDLEVTLFVPSSGLLMASFF